MRQQTAKGPKDRSEKVIARLRQWAFQLDQEMRPLRSIYRDDMHPEIIALKWIDMEALVADLRKCADELQKFTK